MKRIQHQNLLQIITFGLFLTITHARAFAQQILLHSEYQGKLTHISLGKLEIKPLDSVLLKIEYQQPEAYELPKIYLYVDKISVEGDTIEYITYLHKLNDIKTSINLPFYFKEKGKYLITYADARKNPLVSKMIEIDYPANLIFCRNTNESKKAFQHKKYFAKEVGKNIYQFKIYIEIYQKFGVDTLTIRLLTYNDVMKLSPIHQEIQNIDPNATSAVLTFPPNIAPGSYLVQIFGKGGRLIGESQVTLLE